MKTLNFQIEFLSQIVLQASSNTQGKTLSLDFIPGSALLGMVAKNYSSFKDSFKVFHSGAVKFGDANPLKNDECFYKIPLSYFHEKSDNTEIYNHHMIENFSDFTQLKQMRTGFINAKNQRLDLEYRYKQKSAYDSNNGRSKDGQMFGYEALKEGSKWLFSIKISDEICKDDEDLLIKTLCQSTSLGKSKTAEYGRVKISQFNKEQKVQNFTPNNGYTYLYANSRLALIDENGNPSFELKHLIKGLKDENICYDKSQIRTSSFMPFNFTRGGKDYERICINKGSVIVLKDLNNEQIKALENGIGAFLAEGFGEVLINPEFLNSGDQKNPITLQNESTDTQKQNANEAKSKLAQCLLAKKKQKYENLNLLDEVKEFKEANKKKLSPITNSQWGNIRSLCVGSNDNDIFDKIKDYISHGAKKWGENEQNALLNAIERSNNKLKFTKLLAMNMPRQEGENKGGENE
ncbi:MAG: hypothetical protein K5978_05440 [Campylobacter sp.]|nr:hypothetical protein [Campylobacter sp.]